MSDPDTSGAAPPPPIPPPPAGTPTPPMGIPAQPAGPMGPTTQMPTTQPGQGAGIPPGMPPGTRYEDGYGELEPEPDDDDVAWYKRPMALALLLLVLLALGALIVWWLLSGDDDGAASADSSLINLEVTDQDGAPVDTGLLISVDGPPGNETSFQWIRPATAVAGEGTGAGTGADGRVSFEWSIDPDVVDPATWSATVSLVQPLPPNWTPAGAVVECVLQRSGDPDTIVTMSADVSEGDPTTDRVVTYTFPNYQFLAGDTVECEITTVRPVDATTTTTTPATTTPATTVAPTTTTAPTTAPATTEPATTTTVPVVTVPPQPEATLWDVIDNSPDLSSLKALIQLADLVDVLDDPDATLTLLAPTNQAISNAAGGIGAPDFGDSDVVEAVLLTHLNDTDALLAAQLLALDPPEFVVVNPGPHEIDAGASPPTIGEARVVLVDVEASNGVLHVIDRVLLPEALP